MNVKWRSPSERWTEVSVNGNHVACPTFLDVRQLGAKRLIGCDVSSSTDTSSIAVWADQKIYPIYPRSLTVTKKYDEPVAIVKASHYDFGNDMMLKLVCSINGHTLVDGAYLYGADLLYAYRTARRDAELAHITLNDAQKLVSSLTFQLDQLKRSPVFMCPAPPIGYTIIKETDFTNLRDQRDRLGAQVRERHQTVIAEQKISAGLQRAVADFKEADKLSCIALSDLSRANEKLRLTNTQLANECNRLNTRVFELKAQREAELGKREQVSTPAPKKPIDWYTFIGSGDAGNKVGEARAALDKVVGYAAGAVIKEYVEAKIEHADSQR